MRILLATDGSRGDVHPILALATRLRAAGHDPLVCAPPDFAAEASALGLPFRPFGHSIRDYLHAHAEGLLGSPARAFVEGVRFVRANVRAQFEVLPEAARGCDLVIGASLAVAAASAAELHGLPYRFVFYWPGLLPTAELPPFIARSQTLPRWVNRLGWRALLLVTEPLLGRLLSNERRRIGLEAVPAREIYRHMLTNRPILAADRTLAPTPGGVDFHVVQVPCLHAMAGGPLPPKLEAFLEAGPPPVYVGFGSMPDRDPAATTRLVLEAVSRLRCRAVIGAGWAGLGGGPLPEGVLAIESVPHAALFPRCATVVHHGGAGTTTTAARAGAPQVVVPHAADQFYWAHRVTQLGLGPPGIWRAQLTADRLAAALGAILENEVVADRAREVGERLRAEADRDPVPMILE